MLVAGITYRSIGQTIDSEGYLHEAFGLIPISWLFFFIGSISGLFYIGSWILQYFRNRMENG
jgi:hypothetical protein